jgi:hypothetical protein
MGDFGIAHRDKKDAIGAYTVIIANSRIPADYQPGRFHLLGLGIYMRTFNYNCLGFFGHLLHGGTPPLAPEGITPASSACRMLTVCYPKSHILNPAGALYPLAHYKMHNISGPGGSNIPLYSTPEMRSIK